MILSFKNNSRFQLVILLILAVIFFFIYSYLIFSNDLNKFTWPDETANYFFITNYINQSSFSAPETVNEIAGDLIHPRSFNVYDHNLVPGSFVGMLFVYGLVGKIVGPNLIFFLTPLLSVLAGLFFYKILAKIFPQKIAFLSAILFFINPAWWYYSSFSMLPNIAFISFLIIGIYFLLKVDKKLWQRNVFYIVASSFFMGLALIIRTNEFLWIIAVLLFLLIIYHKKIKWYYPVLYIIVLVLVFLPIFYLNQTTYGSALSFGYLRLEQGSGVIGQLPSEFKTSQHSEIYNFVKFLVLPFGLSIKNIIPVFNDYFISLFWWLFVPAVLGLFALIKKYNNKEVAVYLLGFVGISVYLLVYYGSWIFADQMTLQLNKIGISYIRYFLPIYILALPFIAIFYFSFISLFSNKKFKIILSLFLLTSLLYFNINVVYLAGYDNLIKINENIDDYNVINQKITELTEDNAIIISQRSDKIFFPQRKVIATWSFEEITHWQGLLAAGYPLYYYAFEGDEYLYQFNFDLADNYSLNLTNETIIHNNERLFKIEFLADEN
ncbi:ArnT family glycosyltransferase [Patescibacteria group bacterium]